MAACETTANATNARQLIVRHCKRNSLADIGQQWLEVERAMGIEPMGRALQSP